MRIKEAIEKIKHKPEARDLVEAHSKYGMLTIGQLAKLYMLLA